MTSHTVVLKELDSRTLAISKDYETIEVTMPKWTEQNLRK